MFLWKKWMLVQSNAIHMNAWLPFKDDQSYDSIHRFSCHDFYHNKDIWSIDSNPALSYLWQIRQFCLKVLLLFFCLHINIFRFLAVEKKTESIKNTKSRFVGIWGICRHLLVHGDVGMSDTLTTTQKRRSRKPETKRSTSFFVVSKFVSGQKSSSRVSSVSEVVDVWLVA